MRNDSKRKKKKILKRMRKVMGLVGEELLKNQNLILKSWGTITDGLNCIDAEVSVIVEDLGILNRNLEDIILYIQQGAEMY